MQKFALVHIRTTSRWHVHCTRVCNIYFLPSKMVVSVRKLLVDKLIVPQNLEMPFPMQQCVAPISMHIIRVSDVFIKSIQSLLYRLHRITCPNSEFYALLYNNWRISWRYKYVRRKYLLGTRIWHTVHWWMTVEFFICEYIVQVHIWQLSQPNIVDVKQIHVYIDKLYRK